MSNPAPILTLAVDIGGSGTKIIILDSDGNPISDRKRLKPPNQLLLKQLLKLL